MNVRNTIGLIGTFLALFWVFGLMLALDRTRVDEAFLMPSLKSSGDYEIDSVVVTRGGKGEPEEFRFTRKDDQWHLTQGSQSIKVEGFRIRDLIREVKEARRDDETAVPNDPAAYGLQPPRTTVVLSGRPRQKNDDASEKPAREWKLLLGNDSVDKKFVYAASPERPDRVFAVPKSSLAAVFFKSANDLRSKRLFDFSEPTVQSIQIQGGSNTLNLKKTPSGSWLLVTPDLGFADFEGSPIPKDAPPGFRPTDEGVKGLINAIANVKVDAEDDFVPPASDTLARNDLVVGKEKLRIQVLSGDDKKPTDETLLVGRRDGEYFFARLATDEGTFKLPAKLIEPILSALEAPKSLRSRDVSPVSLKEADAITLTQGKDEARFLLDSSKKSWRLDLPGYPGKSANAKVVETLLETLQGRREIVAFKDVADGKTLDADLGLDDPRAVVSVYRDSVEASKSAPGEVKQKADAKPAVTLAFGKVDDDKVWVKRTMPEGPITRFAIKKSEFDRIIPREGLIGYLEPLGPQTVAGDVVRIEISHDGKSIVLDKSGDRWKLQTAAGEESADPAKVDELLKTFTALPLHRWVKKVDAKDDLDSLGLKSPGVTLTLTTKSNQLTAEGLGSMLAQFGNLMTDPSLSALGSIIGNLQLGGEKIVTKFGKAGEGVDAGNVYVQSSKTDLLSLAPDVFARQLKDIDFRDRSTTLGPQIFLTTAAIGTPAGQSFAGFVNASPLVTGRLGRRDASMVKELRVAVRTPIELRTFAFTRKDNGWVDQSGLKEFQIDGGHVDQVARLVAELEINRVILLAGGPKVDQKLAPTEAALVIDAVFQDGATATLTVGGRFESVGYFTQTSTWPGAIFFLNPDQVEPISRGAGFFARQRIAAN